MGKRRNLTAEAIAAHLRVGLVKTWDALNLSSIDIFIDAELPNGRDGYIDGAAILVYATEKSEKTDPCDEMTVAPTCMVYLGCITSIKQHTSKPNARWVPASVSNRGKQPLPSNTFDRQVLNPTDVTVYDPYNRDDKNDIIYDLNAPESLDAITNRVAEIITIAKAGCIQTVQVSRSGDSGSLHTA